MARIYLLLLLIVFFGCSVAKDIPGFWTIDCGGTGFEAKNNITWVSDDGFVRTGVSQEGQNGSLRAFPSKKYKKNCYTIPVEKGVKILARVYFLYGDYDGLGSPPEMRLIFDGYDWGSLQTSMEGEFVEVIYITKRNGTNICFGRTSPNQDPFVSIIKVRTLGLSSYTGDDDSIVLGFLTRDAFGADDIIRYPDDIYDRTWFPRSDGFTVLRSDTNYTNMTSWPTDDNPPSLLTRTAVGPLNGSSPKLSISLSDLPTDPISIYYNIYFSEVSNRTVHGSRAFNLFIDGIPQSDEPIVPPYQSLDEYYDYGVEASNNTIFDFIGTQNATLPPIITAMEIYNMRNASNGTFGNDVTAIEILQESFTVLQNWTGDPCLPVNYNWEWVVCNDDSSPRVKELHLGGYQLSGTLPNFSNLTALEIIDLHNNSLTGGIPAFLGSLPSLRTLNLSMNDFSSIPSTLTQNTLIKLDVTGNPKLCNPGVTCVGPSPPLPSSRLTSSLLPPSSPPSVPPPPSTNFGAIIGNRVTVRVILLQFVFFLVSMVFVVV